MKLTIDLLKEIFKKLKHIEKYQIYWKYKYHKTLNEWAKNLTLPTSNYPKGSTCFNNMHFIVRNVVKKMKNEGFQSKINKSSSHLRGDNG